MKRSGGPRASNPPPRKRPPTAKYIQERAPRPPSDSEPESLDDSDMEGEQIHRVQQASYEQHINSVRTTLGNTRPNLLHDNQERACLVCQPKAYFKGWRALMAHAEKYKKRLPQQHRGFFRALQEVVLPNADHGAPKMDLASTRAAATTAASSVSRIVWPPVLQFRGEGGEEIARSFIKTEAFERTLTSPRGVLVILKDLPLSLAEVHRVVESRQGLFRELQPSDMMNMDPHKNHIVWSSTTKEQVVQRLKDLKKADDEVQAEVSATMLKDYKLDTNQEKLGFDRYMANMLLQQKKDELEKLGKETQAQESDRARMHQLANERFQREMKNLEAAKRLEEARLWKVMQHSTRVSEERKNEVLQYNQRLKEMLLHRTQQGKALSEKYLKLQGDKRRLEDECRAMHSGMDENLRVEEMRLELELDRKLKLIESEYLNGQSDVLSQFITDQRQSKEKGCVVCFEEFGPKLKRGMLSCGHARACISCLLAIYESKRKECPDCRAAMKSRPVATVDQLYY